MLRMYKNKKNLFECKLEIEGASLEKAKPRLILFPHGDNRNIFFEGSIEGGECKIVITPNLDISKNGKVMLEVIIDDSTLFTPWKSEYEIITEQIKVQNESVSLSFEKSAPTIRLIEDVQIKDEKNKIIEPKVIVETSKVEEIKKVDLVKEQPKKVESISPTKKGVFTESCTSKDKELVNKILESTNALRKSEKKSLLEYVNTKYNPTEKSKRWASKVFNESDSLASKISMYCLEMKSDKK